MQTAEAEARERDKAEGIIARYEIPGFRIKLYTRSGFPNPSNLPTVVYTLIADGKGNNKQHGAEWVVDAAAPVDQVYGMLKENFSHIVYRCFNM